jgi:hypothetical protein
LYDDDCCEEFPPMSSVGGDMDLTALEMASLELLTLCDDSGARRGLYNDLLALLHQFHKQKVDITNAKACHLIVWMRPRKEGGCTKSENSSCRWPRRLILSLPPITLGLAT